MGNVQQIDLMIAGAQKAGTTSLFRYLGQHPQVQVHRQAEMSFFVNDAEFERGDAYAWKKYFGATRCSGRKLVAKHVLLMYSPQAIRRLAAHNDKAHVVVSLRDPVDRAYSAYWYARRKGWEPIDSFEEAVASEADRLRQGWYRWRHNAYLAGGHYAEFISDLLSVFPRERIQLFSIEDLREQPRQICRSLYRALDVDGEFQPQIAVRYNRAATVRSVRVAGAVQRMAASRHPLRNALRRLVPASLSNGIRRAINRWNEVEFEPPAMSEATRATLRTHFRPHNERLGELLGRDFSAWDR